MQSYQVHLTPRSANAKTGPISVSTTTADTCPDTCAFKHSGCYAEGGPLLRHWKKITKRERGTSWRVFCASIKALPQTQLWRHNQAGDLPGDGKRIDSAALEMLLDANEGKRGFTYTHYLPDTFNAPIIAMANRHGFVVNLSADSLAQADEYAEMGIAPVVTVLPAAQMENTATPAGRRVVICPAVTRDDITCATCQLCARSPREAIVGFPAHGSGVKKTERALKERRNDA